MAAWYARSAARSGVDAGGPGPVSWARPARSSRSWTRVSYLAERSPVSVTPYRKVCGMRSISPCQAQPPFR